MNPINFTKKMQSLGHQIEMIHDNKSFLTHVFMFRIENPVRIETLREEMSKADMRVICAHRVGNAYSVLLPF